MRERRETLRTPNRPGSAQFDFSPKHINLFLQCPERYYWSYVRRTRTPWVFSRNLEIGRACHNVLAFIWNQRRAGFEDPDDLTSLIRRYLREADYPPDESVTFHEDVETIARYVERTLDLLNADASVDGVEEELASPLRREGARRVEIRSKIDLVLDHGDGEIEHIDYKTGKPERDLIQEVMSRVVLRSRLAETERHLQRLVTTTIFAKDGSLVREELDRDQFRGFWEEIVGSINRIRSADSWKPKPGPYCQWCGFSQRRCSVRGEANE